MAEETMPATEAETDAEQQDERSDYELAFHVLPTVAEEEVTNVQTALRTIITNAGGVVEDEETAERFELAYTIYKEIEGKKRGFDTAYFGWIRFSGDTSVLDVVHEQVDTQNEILRSMIVKLTREEVAHPFKVHEIISKMPETVGDAEGEGEVIESKTKEEPNAEVKEEELDESLDKITN